MSRFALGVVVAVFATAVALAAVSRVDEALLTAAQKAVPREVAASELLNVLQGGLWNSNRTAVAFVLPRPKASIIVILLRQPSGSYIAADASGVEGGNFGKLGRPRTDYSRFETTPVKWLSREDGMFQVRMRTRAWRTGQRYTVSEDLIIKSNGTVLYR